MTTTLNMKKYLKDFRSRCPGVLGAIVANSSDDIIESELPSFLEIDLTDLIGQISDIYLAMEELQKKSLRKTREHDIILRFNSIIVFAKTLPTGTLLILAEEDSNIGKVRSLSKLLIKKLDSALRSGKD